MAEDIFFSGRIDDLSDPRQLEELNQWIARVQARVNQFDPNSFALAWIEGYAAGAVIASMGVGVAPVWNTSPTLTALILSGLTASQVVVTDASKQLATTATPEMTGAKLTGLTANRIVATDADKNLVSVLPGPGYTVTNVDTDRNYNADTVAIDELADVVGTLIADLQTKGIVS